MAVEWARSIPAPVSDNVEDAIADLKQMIDIGLENNNRYKIFEPPEEIPTNIDDRTLHPDNPADNDWSIVYDHCFKHVGYAAIGTAVMTRAKEHSEDDEISPKQNYTIIDDKNLVGFTMILASMYPKFLSGLICGDVFFQYANDLDMRRALNLMHPLEKTPGNYLQGLVLDDSLFGGAASGSTYSTQAHARVDNPHKGRSLTLSQLHNIYQAANDYLPSSPTKDLSLVNAVDNAYTPGAKGVDYAIGKHKYVQAQHGTSRGNEDRFKTWLEELRRVYIERIEKMMKKNPQDPILHVPMRVSFLEVGWGQDVKARASGHDDHTNSNKLFTFFQALIKIRFGDQVGQAKFDVVRRATNLLTRGHDIEAAYLDARLADVGVTMIGQTEWFNGGLNPVPGGGGGVNKESLQRRLPYIREQAEKTYTSKGSRFKLNIIQDREKLVEFQKIEKLTDQDLDMEEQALEEKRELCQKKWERIAEEMKLLEDVRLTFITENLVASAGQIGEDKDDEQDGDDADMQEVEQQSSQ